MIKKKLAIHPQKSVRHDLPKLDSLLSVRVYLLRFSKSVPIEPTAFFDSKHYAEFPDWFRVQMLFSIRPNISDYSTVFFECESLMDTAKLTLENYANRLLMNFPTMSLNSNLVSESALNSCIDIVAVKTDKGQLLDKLFPKGFNLQLQGKRLSFSGEQLETLKGIFKGIDKAVSGLMELYSKGALDVKSRLELESVIRGFFQARDLTMVYFERVIKENYNSLVSSKSNPSSPVFVVSYGPSLMSDSFNSDWMDKRKLVDLFCEEVSDFLKLCNGLSSELKPYVVRSGLDMSLLSLAKLVKEFNNGIFLNWSSTRAMVSHDDVDIFVQAVFTQHFDVIRTRMESICNGYSSDPIIYEALQSYLFKLEGSSPTMAWANQGISKLGTEYVFEDIVSTVSWVGERYYEHENPDAFMDKLYNYAVKSKDFLSQVIYLNLSLSTVLPQTTDVSTLANYLDTTERLLFVSPLKLKSGKLFNRYLHLYNVLDGDLLKKHVKSRIDQNLRHHFSVFDMNAGTYKNHMNSGHYEFEIYVENIFKYLILAKRLNLLRLTVMHVESLLPQKRSTDVETERVMFLRDLVTRLKQDYNVGEYEVTDRRYNFKAKLDAGMCNWEENRLPIRQKVQTKNDLVSDKAPQVENLQKQYSKVTEIEYSGAGAGCGVSRYKHTDRSKVKTKGEPSAAMVDEVGVADRHQDNASEMIEIPLKRKTYSIYERVMAHRSCGASQTGITLEELKELFTALSSSDRFRINDDSAPQNKMIASIAKPDGTSHRKLQLGVSFYVDGEHRTTLVSTKPVTVKEGVVPDYQIKQIRQALESLPIRVSCC